MLSHIAEQIYAVAAPYEDGIHLLDFFQDASSPNHVDHGYEILPVDCIPILRGSVVYSKNALLDDGQTCFILSLLLSAQSCLGGHRQNRFLTLSEEVTSCAAHPLNGTIIAGTMVWSQFPDCNLSCEKIENC